MTDHNDSIPTGITINQLASGRFDPSPEIRGLLLLDVDGPLHPYGANAKRRPDGYRSYRYTPDGRWYTGKEFRRHKGIYVWLNPGHGPMILDVAAATKLQPVWATTWQDEANTLISPAVGLPPLPVITFPAEDLDVAAHRPWAIDGRWKYGAVGTFAQGLPLAWLDDEHDLRVAVADEYLGVRERLIHHRTAARDKFLSDRRESPTLLCAVDPATGITENHLDQIRTWSSALP
jgi:hypothetical protein